MDKPSTRTSPVAENPFENSSDQGQIDHAPPSLVGSKPKESLATMRSLGVQSAVHRAGDAESGTVAAGNDGFAIQSTPDRALQNALLKENNTEFDQAQDALPELYRDARSNFHLHFSRSLLSEFPANPNLIASHPRAVAFDIVQSLVHGQIQDFTSAWSKAEKTLLTGALSQVVEKINEGAKKEHIDLQLNFDSQTGNLYLHNPNGKNLDVICLKPDGTVDTVELFVRRDGQQQFKAATNTGEGKAQQAREFEEIVNRAFFSCIAEKGKNMAPPVPWVGPKLFGSRQ